MSRLLVLVSVVVLAIAAVAQVPIPGTFSTLPAHPGTSLYAPVLSPPTVTLGNGLTPGVVTNETSYYVSAPQNTPLVPSLINVSPTRESSDTANSNEDSDAVSPGNPAARRGMFDFIVAGNGSSTYAPVLEDPRSLAEVAAAVRRSTVQPTHVYTNDDIARMNRKYGSSKTTPNPALNASSDN